VIARKSYQREKLGTVDLLVLTSFDQLHLPYFIEYSVHYFQKKNYAEILPAHYSWKVLEKRFKIIWVIC
jgi:hypothetical protein